MVEQASNVGVEDVLVDWGSISQAGLPVNVVAERKIEQQATMIK